MSAIEDQPIPIDSLGSVGASLQRPECVLATEAGDLLTCDWRGVVARIHPDGRETVLGPENAVANGIKSNGIALMPDGSFLFANVGEAGGVWRLGVDGSVDEFLREVDGEKIPSTNFVHLDHQQRLWICVSTRDHASHRVEHKFSQTQADGYVAVVDARGSRIVADGLVWTNECRVDPTGRFLYVNETMARRLTRFAIDADSGLRDRETVAEFGHGVWPDGLAFDQAGGVWITSPISNRVIRIAPSGKQQLLLEDSDAQHVEQAEAAFQRGELTRAAIYGVPSRKLMNLSSLAFGGPDLKTVYLGSLRGNSVPCFRSEFAGFAPAHWKTRLP